MGLTTALGDIGKKNQLADNIKHMIQTFTLTSIAMSTSDRSGTPYTDKKTGESKARVIITADNLPNGKKEASTFVYKNSPILKWTMGETHEADFTLSPDGKYLNFFPTKREIAPNQNPAITPVQTASVSKPVVNPSFVGFTQADRDMLIWVKKELEAHRTVLNALMTYITGSPIDGPK